MIKMGTRDATLLTTDLADLEMIDEYLKENMVLEKMISHRKLPGPPPPPQDEPEECKRTPQPVLVPRGTGPQEPLSVSQLSSPPSSMASPHSTQGPSRRSRVARTAVSSLMGSASRPEQGNAVFRRQEQSDTALLERFLEKPVLEVVEQPKERGMRFRYECEGRSAGSILGASSTESNKTLPAVEIKGCPPRVKEVKITVSLVTKDIPHRPHPHSLVGKDCAEGICVVRLKPSKSCKHCFSNLGIQCVRRKELDLALEKRRKQNIDPFNTGHSRSIEDVDMNVVRLCFQCELETEDKEKISLSPVVSNAIYDKKATTTSELKITRLNVTRGPCTGKTEIYLLCDKVQKDDIEIIFSLGKWEAKAEFAQTDVHRQIAIVFKSPPYQEPDIHEEVDVNVFLRRLSDHMDSEPVKFTYEPQNLDPFGVNRKRKLKSDIKFGERCSVAAQSLTLPESPDPLLFSRMPFGLSDAPAQRELGATSLGPQVLGEIHYPSPSVEVKQEADLCPGLDMLDSSDFQAIMTGISQALESSGIVAGSPLLPFPGFHLEPGSQQGYGLHPSTSAVAPTFSQDPNSNYTFPSVDFNCNLSGDGGPQLDLNFYNDVQINRYGQPANGTHPFDPLNIDPQLVVFEGQPPQPLVPRDGEGPLLETESHIEL
ncbi:hypothetical protein GJAV_G00058810 [Gymnothorax javanicus]|nr:hypothetical protein GJAV_G00058810 [Gymnothorax javanicus]